MQSSVVRKLDELLPVEETERHALTAPDAGEPKFGDRTGHRKKLASDSGVQDPSEKSGEKDGAKSEAQKKLEVHSRIINLKAADLYSDLPDYTSSIVSQPIALGYLNQDSAKVQALLPTIFRDVLSHSFLFVLILAVTCLSIFKVQFVQDTRELTVQYNEAIRHNEILHKEWLLLLSERESLTEYSVIRQSASQKLGMVHPRTEDEIVIDLR